MGHRHLGGPLRCLKAPPLRHLAFSENRPVWDTGVRWVCSLLPRTRRDWGAELICSPRSWPHPWGSIPRLLWLGSEMLWNASRGRRFGCFCFYLENGPVRWLLCVLSAFPDKGHPQSKSSLVPTICLNLIFRGLGVGERAASVMTPTSCQWLHVGKMQSVGCGEKLPLHSGFCQHVCVKQIPKRNKGSMAALGVGVRMQLSAEWLPVCPGSHVSRHRTPCLSHRCRRPGSWRGPLLYTLGDQWKHTLSTQSIVGLSCPDKFVVCIPAF